MKNYLIISSDISNINDNINYILKELNLTYENVIKFDLANAVLDSVIEELNTYGLFTENKVVVLTSCSFLSKSNNNSDISHDENNLISYIKNPNPLNSLVIITDDMDERKKITKLIKATFTIIENNISIKQKIKTKVEDFNISDRTIDYLIDYLNNDNSRILNEFEKLKLYKLEEKIVTIEDINNIVVKEFNENIFTLINFIIKKDVKNAFKIYNELISRGEDITKIIISVVDQIRLIYKTKILVNEGKNKDFIASMFKVHPYRIKLAIEYSYTFTNDELLKYIKILGNMDIAIKTGNETSKHVFELFLLDL